MEPPVSSPSHSKGINMTAALPREEMMGTVGVPLRRTMTGTRPMDSALRLVFHFF